MLRREFLQTSLGAAAATAIDTATPATLLKKRWNVLFLTVDDMDVSIPGFMGNRHDLTPNLDRLASTAFRFVRNRTVAAICQPSREAMMTGRVPHHSGGTGFDPIYEGTPTLVSALKSAGYFVGVVHKVPHMAPPSCFPWDYIRANNDRRPTEYAGAVAEAIGQAKQAGKPFYVNCNINDPHRPFYGSELVKGEERGETEGWKVDNPVQPEDVDVPPHLEDLAPVRKELSQYWTSARRMDKSIGAVLAALDASGHAEDTLVFFSADHGMPFPFSKATTYDHGTRTPALVRYPGMSAPREFHERTANIDYMPTLLELLHVPAPAGMDGHSWVPLLEHGHDKVDREFLVTNINGISSGQNYPSRCIQDDRYALMFRPWSDGKRALKTESMTGLTYPAMEASAQSDKAMRARLDEYIYGVPLAFFDLASDPGQRVNLLHMPQHSARVERMKQQLRTSMSATSDPQLANWDAFLVGKQMFVDPIDHRHVKGEE
jgi:N-sulfoglucosamine sulfohydrolase